MNQINVRKEDPQQTEDPCPTRKRLTFEDVINEIVEYGGPEGTDFECCDLSGVDLGWEKIRNYQSSKYLAQAPWYSSSTHGINLRGARFQHTKLDNANLTQADFREATLYDASLQEANLHDSKFTDSFLVKVKAPKADFSFCDMRSCYLLDADLRRTDLSYAQLQGANLGKAEIQGANLFRAWIVGTYLTRQQIGDLLIQETSDWPPSNKEISVDWPGRYAQAASIYRTLKNNFLSIGNYQDASWAYVKERRNRKKTHWPPKRIRENYPGEYAHLSEDSSFPKWKRLTFYTKHLLAWILDWGFELTSVYGEKPLLPLIWALVFILGFSVLFQWVGGIRGANTWVDYFNYSLGSFVTLGFGHFNVADSRLIQTLTSIEALLGICVLALLMFALGNRINRS